MALRYKGIKGKAWEAVKAYIRERDLKADGSWDCFTCQRRIESSRNAHTGHFIPVGVCGSNNSLAWDEINLHIQCMDCNVNRGGWGERYTEMMEKVYDNETVEDLRKRRFKVDPIKDWQKVIDHYTYLKDNL